VQEDDAARPARIRNRLASLHDSHVTYPTQRRPASPRAMRRRHIVDYMIADRVG
jgi:hypothetical protein